MHDTVSGKDLRNNINYKWRYFKLPWSFYTPSALLLVENPKVELQITNLEPLPTLNVYLCGRRVGGVSYLVWKSRTLNSTFYPLPENREVFRCYWLLYSSNLQVLSPLQTLSLHKYFCMCLQMCWNVVILIFSGTDFLFLRIWSNASDTVDTLTQPSVLTTSIHELVTSSTVRYVRVQYGQFQNLSNFRAVFYVSAMNVQSSFGWCL